MDKIRVLLEQLGGSKELVDQILESLDQFKQDTIQKVKAEYTTRLDKAKEVCLEETQAYRKELARKLQIFFESRVEKIEQQIAKQVAIRDSAAESKLQAIVGLLEGVEVDGKGNNADFQAAQKQIKQLRESLRKTSQENKVLSERANRAHTIAEKTLERNKILFTELAESKKQTKNAISDSKPAKKGKVVTEGRKKPAPATSRPTKDIQIAKPKEKKSGPMAKPSGYSPEAIASNLDD